LPLIIQEIAMETNIDEKNVIDIFNTMGGSALSQW
jgi:hypothetical protein